MDLNLESIRLRDVQDESHYTTHDTGGAERVHDNQTDSHNQDEKCVIRCFITRANVIIRWVELAARIGPSVWRD
jgi:hypothetical protein